MTEAYMRGVLDGGRQGLTSHCPYPRGSSEETDWMNGVLQSNRNAVITDGIHGRIVRVMEEPCIILNGHVDEQSIPSEKRML